VPAVTVLMAVRNEEARVASAIEKLISQHYRDFELLIVDDGSTDRTVEVIERVGDEKIRLVRRHHAGQTAALNVGLSLARGDLVARHDADDISRPQRLARQVEFLAANPSVAIVGSAVVLVTDTGHTLAKYVYPPDHKSLVQRLNRVVNPLPHSSIMFRRREILALGGYQELYSKAQDYDLYLRVAEHHQLASIPEALCVLRHSLTSLSFRDGGGEQWKEAVLAYLLSVARRELGIDLVTRKDWSRILSAYDRWFSLSPFPSRAHSLEARRRAKLSWSKRQYVTAAFDVARAFACDPAWPLRRSRWATADLALLRGRCWIRKMAMNA
jgi:glycosyltransferase involved in cell wall biosynthesis